jgi:hypothetical protein
MQNNLLPVDNNIAASEIKNISAGFYELRLWALIRIVSLHDKILVFLLPSVTRMIITICTADY